MGNLRVDLAYAMVALGGTTLWSVLNGWLLYFYLPPAGAGTPLVPVALYSVALFGNRVIDALIDPPIGYLTDHTRTRWGRRLPFMAASALPLAVCFVLLWTPPVRGESIWNLVYLAVILELYSVAHSFLHISYEALLPELALADQRRTRISAWSAGCQAVAMILGSLAGLLVEKLGYVTMALCYAGVALPFFYLPLLVLRERPERWVNVAERLNFFKSLATTFRNPSFPIYTVTWSLYWATMTLITAAIPFVATQICLLTEADTIYFYLPMVLASLLCYPLIAKLADRLGKWRVFCGSLLASAAMLASLMLIGDWLPIPLKAQGIAWAVAGAVAVSGVVVLSPVIAAEVIDYDEKLTGQRREGVYFASWSLLDNTVSGLGAAILPLLLLLGGSRNAPRGPLGVRLAGVVCAAMMFIAFLVFWRYPLRPTKARENVEGAGHV